MNFISLGNRAHRALAAVIGISGTAAALLLAQPACAAVVPGQPAPAFELPGTAGAVRLEQYQGKLVYLDFWASWCGPCRHSFPWMNEMQAKYGAQGLQVVGINVDAKTDDARSFLANTPARFVVAFDPAGAAPRQYGIKGMPSSVLIGPDGKILFEHSGFREGDRAELESRIRAALGAKK
ncbi:TlpA disulfide reductase family protein [Massilia sp. Root351]|jgi:peroxiredoxin|uniref:TlpA family protein disulfide reductase n=1 Tax=Massilia sp. Root351 TaxID=1736522 RepID=UPI0009E9495D|nr:TlpA disulfide reductase family protein [Massilia sp. Root351]